MIKEILDDLYEEIKHGDEEHQQWLKDKIDEFALKYNPDKERLEMLEKVKFGFDIFSDHSTHCLGYRSLCREIDELKVKINA